MYVAYVQAWLMTTWRAWFRRTAPIRHEGATLEWSPQATTEAVGGPSGWDTGGWYQQGQRDTHRALQRAERRDHDRLDALLAAVNEWRDADGTIPWRACWRPGSLGFRPWPEVRAEGKRVRVLV